MQHKCIYLIESKGQASRMQTVQSGGEERLVQEPSQVADMVCSGPGGSRAAQAQGAAHYTFLPEQHPVLLKLGEKA